MSPSRTPSGGPRPLRRSAHARTSIAARTFIEHLEMRRLLSGAAGESVASHTAGGDLVAPRIMENLGRGVVAVRTGSNAAFVTWRLLALDPTNIAFNVYRSVNGAAFTKLNGSPLTQGTNYSDSSSAAVNVNRYHVRSVIGGIEQPQSEAFTLKANGIWEPAVRIPLTAPLAGYRTKSIWVGDLDGDGEFDYVIDRLAPFYKDPVTNVENNDIGTGNQFLEAYTSKGTKLWSIDMGLTSRGTYNISPGAATLSMGMWDGATVGDLNGDGKAEVVLKIANGVKFADGTTFTTTNDQRQFIAVINGLTGTKMAQLEFPADHAYAGRLSTMLGIGNLNGGKPSIVGWLRNRNPDTSAYGQYRKQFNDIMIAWDWSGGSTISQKWKLVLTTGNANWLSTAGFHQMRIVDVNGDGSDDVLPGNYAISGATGQILYKIPGIGHGDRFHVGDFDPDRPGLEGFGIQQNGGTIGLPNMVLDYYYDADDGTLLWTNNGTGYDVGRGSAGDIDPTKRGYEVWSFEGLHRATNTKEELDDNATDSVPWPNLRIWWDGDLGSEELDASNISKYDYLNKTKPGRLFSGYKAPTYARTDENFPMIYGDLFGDWREEAVYTNGDFSELVILTTNIPTTTRIYTHAQNPYYRNQMTVKGYYQSNHVDYYLGTGMTTPPTPNITYATAGVAVTAAAFLDETAPYKLTFSFNNYVGTNLDVADLTVTRAGGGTATPTGFAYDLATNIATFTFAAPLPDGDYTATLNANGFTDPSGRKLAANYAKTFNVMAGDANHDRLVNFDDLLILAQNYGTAGKTFSQGNFNYDATGNVDFDDLLILAQRYNTPLATLAATAPTPAAKKTPRAAVSKLVL